MADKTKQQKIIYRSIQILMMALFCIFIFVNRAVDADYSLDDNSLYDWSEDWMMSYGTTSAEKINLPTVLDVEPGKAIVLRKSLPNTIKKYNSLMIESNRQDITVQIDGVLRKAYSDKETRKAGYSSPSAIVIVPLYNTDEGKDVSILITSNTSYSGDIEKVYLGNEMSIVLTLIRKNMGHLIIDTLLFIIALLCIAGFFAFGRTYARGKNFLYLFWTALFSALWCFTQLRIRQLFAGDIAFLENFGYVCLMLMPLPLLNYYALLMPEHNTAVVNVAETIAVANFLIEIILQILGVTGFYELQGITQVIVQIVTIIVLVLYIKDIRHSSVVRGGYHLVGLLCLELGMVLEAVNRSFHISHNVSGRVALGVLGYLLINMIDTVKDISIEQQRKLDAERANNAKSQFLATMSHEIRTPINSVLGMNEMIMRDTKETAILGYAQNIDSAGKMLLGLINDILDFSKIESGKLDILVADYDTNQLFVDLYNMVEKRARQKGLTLVVDIDPELPSKLKGDRSRVLQILTNILTNAVKYTSEGKVELSVSMVEGANIPTLQVSVRDSGQGIKPEDMDKLFSSFTRLNEQKNKSIEGTGLGLAITKQLVKMMKGDIEVESVYGEGSTFTVTIPQEVIDASPIGKFETSGGNKTDKDGQAKQELTFVCPEGKVLIVDDNRVNLIVASGLMKPSQVQITTALSGDEAIELCRTNKYDLIFMDHMMPVKDGIETLHELKETFGEEWNTPVVVLTANAIEGMKDMYLTEGFNDYLTKPMTAVQLEEMLIKYITK